MTTAEAIATVLVAAMSGGGAFTVWITRRSKAHGVTERDVADTTRPVEDAVWEALRPVLQRVRVLEEYKDKQTRLVRVVGKRLDLNTFRLKIYIDAQETPPAEVLLVHDDLVDLSRTLEEEDHD